MKNYPGRVISLFVVLSFFCLGSFRQSSHPLKVSWKNLQDVRFRKKTNKEDGMVYLYPEFGAGVKALAGKWIEIRGFMIPVDPSGKLLVLSANPMASCFFCGGAGPSSIIELKLAGIRRFKTDEVKTVRGKLKLNPDNINELNYILEEAEIR